MRSKRLQKKDVWYKDRSQMREQDSASDQVKSTRSYIKDYSLKNKVVLEWDMNKDSIEDRMCVLTIGTNKAVVDWEELLRAGRFV